jgi:hypothetical protein
MHHSSAHRHSACQNGEGHFAIHHLPIHTFAIREFTWALISHLPPVMGMPRTPVADGASLTRGKWRLADVNAKRHAQPSG